MTSTANRSKHDQRVNRLDPSWVQALADEVAADLGIVGAQVAIATGEDILEVATGLANAEQGRPVTTETLFQVGSTTKLHTALLVMQLVDEGLVGLDEPVASYLPGIPLGTDDTWTAEVTPRQLMSMTSGIDNGPYDDTGVGDDSIARSVAQIAPIPMTHRPGTAYGYSNASTNVSGLLVERITGLTWDAAMEGRLLTPAGLSRSVTTPYDLLFHEVAVGHLPGPDGEPVVIRPFGLPRGMGPAGGTLCTSAGDLVRLAQLFLREGAAADGTRVLSAEAVTQMHTRQVDVPAVLFADGWCVGPFVKVWDGVQVFGHTGTNTGGSSCLLWVPEFGVAIATTVNVANMGYPFADRVVREVFERLVGIVKPGVPDPVPLDPAEVAQVVGYYEMYGAGYDVVANEAGLSLTVTGTAGAPGTESWSQATDLIPIGAYRYLPTDEAITANHMWEIAFVPPTDGEGCPLLYNGAFAARRTAR